MQSLAASPNLYNENRSFVIKNLLSVDLHLTIPLLTC